MDSQTKSPAGVYGGRVVLIIGDQGLTPYDEALNEVVNEYLNEALNDHLVNDEKQLNLSAFF